MPAEAAIAVGILKFVGGAIPQCIPQELKDKLARPVSYVLCYGSNSAEILTKIEELKGAKVEVEARLLVAETNGDQIRHMIEEWLKDANTILVKFETPEGNHCFCGSSCEVGKMLDEIKKMLEQSKSFHWVAYPRGPPPIGSRYHAYNKSLSSRENMLVKIVEALKDSGTNMFSISGVPGVGKTTLLEELIKGVEAMELFQVIAKVDVSQSSDTRMIQSSISARIQLDLPEQGDEETRANLLYQQLKTRLLNKGSKILVAFDDICTESDIDTARIGIPFSLDGESSCRILLSSRSSDVCNKMGGNCNALQLDYLSPVEAKILFRDRLGNHISDEEYMTEKYISMENDVLQVCGGLPRAITTLAEVLKMRWPDRDDVVSQLRIHNLSEVHGVTKTLHQSIEVSYNLLKDDMEKKIFQLCCLFRPGTSIVIEGLIRYGIGLNLFDRIKSLDDVRQRAKLRVNQLKSLTLFESKDGQCCISVHTIIHDFATSIASEGEYLLLLDDGARWKNKEDFKKYTVISMTIKSSVNRKHLNGSETPHPIYDFEHLNGLELPKLEALFLKGESSNLQDRYFTRKENLKVLVMTKMKLSTLPPSVKHLKRLLTLSVEYCEIEDASVVSLLVSLKVLSFRGSKIKVFPSGIAKLGDLKLLDITGCFFGTVLDDVVVNLSHLEELYMCGTSVNQDATGGVVIQSLFGGLKSFEHLNVLEIEIPSHYLQNVGDLLLSRYPLRFKIVAGCKVPSPYKEFFFFKRVMLLKGIDARRIMKQGLRNLLKKTEFLSLENITDLKKVVYELDEDGLLELIHLHISRCSQMECIINTMGMSAEFKILRNLEIISLEQLDGLQVIYYGRTSQNWCSKLRELKLSNLRELKPNALLIDHAHKLDLVEVRDCANLKHIFSTITAPEISIGDEGYDFPCLKKLDLQRLPMLEGLCAEESRMNDQTCQPLFHEKVYLTALEELYLSSLDNIKDLWKLGPSDSTSAKATFSKLQLLILDKMFGLKHVWSMQLCEGSLSFGSLKRINIIECSLLESLCPPSVLAALSNLDSLEITSCHSLKEVVMTETSANNAIKFPSLRSLKLKKLSSLQRFSQGSCTIEFPSLEKLSLSSLPKVVTFHDPLNSDVQGGPMGVGIEQNAQEGSTSLTRKMPFIREIVFPSLEHLKLTAMEDISELVKEDRAAIAFPKLKTLTIKELGKLKSIPATLLEKLEQLKVHSCGSLQGLFEGNFATSILSLRKLELVDVRCLKHIPWNWLPNIHSLVIHGGLLDVKYMLSSTSIVEGKAMQKVEYINIEGCKHLEEIVSKKCDQPDLLKKGTVMFPRLKHVKFHSLPSITTFSSGSYEATFPALENVEISSCPNLVSFSSGELQTPKLTILRVVGKDGVQTSISQEDIDINCFLRGINQGHQLHKESEQSQQLPPSNLTREEMKVVNGFKETFSGGNLPEKHRLAKNGESSSSNAGSLQSSPIYV